MAAIILFDSDRGRAVLYDTTSERALNHAGFIGSDAGDQASDFIDWLDDDDDPRSYPKNNYTLDDMIGLWTLEAFDEVFIGHRRVRVLR